LVAKIYPSEDAELWTTTYSRMLWHDMLSETKALLS